MSPGDTTVRDAFVELRGLTFHYRDWGGEGQPLVLLHGLASNARFWDLAAPHLVPRFRVVALDQRGHGASAKPEEGYDVPSVAADAVAFIDSLALAQKPVLVGHSWGGNVVVQVAAEYPGLLAGAVCVDGGTIEPSSALGATWEETERALAPPDLTRFTVAELLARSREWPTAAYWGDKLEGFFRANFDVLGDGRVRPKLSREKHMRIVRALWDQRVSELFPRIACPVLLLPARQRDMPAGAGSSSFSLARKEAAIEQAARLIPRCRVVWMEDSIHDVPVQRPVEVARAIRDAVEDGFLVGQR